MFDVRKDIDLPQGGGGGSGLEEHMTRWTDFFDRACGRLPRWDGYKRRVWTLQAHLRIVTNEPTNALQVRSHHCPGDAAKGSPKTLLIAGPWCGGFVERMGRCRSSHLGRLEVQSKSQMINIDRKQN